MTALSHEQVVLRRGSRSGLPIMVAIHSTVFGPAAGGVRLATYDDWRDGLEDALRLSEAMTLKCAIAQLPNGGGKTVIALPPGEQLVGARRRAAMLDLGDAIDSLGGRYLAGEDVGTTAEDLLVARERTPYAFCLPKDAGGIGDPSEPTAVGVVASLRAICDRLFGSPSLAGRRFTVIGLGNVGGRIARLLAADGAVLAVADVDAAKAALADELGATWIGTGEALGHEADVLVPAALGGFLTRDSVPELRCRAVCGPANNQLATPEVAGLLDEAGVLWAPDFVVNGGGVLFGALVETGQATEDEAWLRVRAIGNTLSEVFAVADADAVTPYVAAERLARTRLAAAARDEALVS